MTDKDRPSVEDVASQALKVIEQVKNDRKIIFNLVKGAYIYPHIIDPRMSQSDQLVSIRFFTEDNALSPTLTFTYSTARQMIDDLNKRLEHFDTYFKKVEKSIPKEMLDKFKDSFERQQRRKEEGASSNYVG